MRKVPPSVLILACCVMPAVLPAPVEGQMRAAFHDDWSGTAPGSIPSTIEVVRGSIAVAEREGGRYLRTATRTDIDIVLSAPLPSEFTVEFEMLVPSTHAYPVEIRAAQPGEGPDYRRTLLRQEYATAQCGAIATGVYGARTNRVRAARTVADSLTRCRVHVRDQLVEVRFGNGEPVVVDGVEFGRTDRLRLTIPAKDGEVAWIGPITITGVSGGMRNVAGPVQRCTCPEVAATPSRPAAATPQADEPAAPAASAPATGAPLATAPPGAGMTPQQAPEYRTAGGVLKPFAAAAAHAQARHDEGIAARVTGAELKQQFGMSRELSAMLLHGAGYTVLEIAAWLEIDGATPGQSVAILDDLGGTPSEIYDALTQSLGLQTTGALQAVVAGGLELEPYVDVLRDRGFSYQQAGPHVMAAASSRPVAAEALNATYDAEPREYVTLLRSMGLEVPEIVQEVAEIYINFLPLMVEALKDEGYTPAQIVAGMKQVMHQAPAEVAKQLTDAGFQLEPTMEALMHNYGVSVEHAVVMFRQFAYTPIEIMQTVQRVYNQPMESLFPAFVQAGYSMEDAFAAMKAGNLTEAQAARAARDAGYAAGAVLQPLLVVFATAPAAAGAVAADMLIKAGYTPEQTALALKNHFNQGATWIARNLNTAGVNAFGVRDALIFAFDMSLEAALGVLAGLGIS